MANNAPFKCTTCNTTVVNRTSWVAHVLSTAHGNKIFKADPNEMEKKRFIIVSGPNVREADMVIHFLRFGLVVDVELVTQRKGSPYFLVEFSDEIGAWKARAKTRQTIRGQKAFVDSWQADFTESNTVNFSTLVGLIDEEVPIGQAQLLIKVVEMTQKELDARKKFRAELERWLRRNMCDSAEVHLFGSCLTGLGFRGTDIDLYVDFGFQGSERHSMQQQQVRDCAHALRMHSGIDSIRAIKRARVPIVKFFSNSTGVNVDLSFRNAMSLRNSEAIRTYVNGKPWVRCVLMVLRWWAKTHGLTISGRRSMGFSTYAFSWLVLFALMNSPEDPIPSVHQFQEGAPVDEIEGWNCGFGTKWPGNVRENVCIFKMMLHFFEFYSKLDFGLYVVCPLVGKLVPRFLFGNPDRLGPEFLRYKERCREGKCDVMPMNSAACLQDPFELNFNAARTIRHAGIEQFAVKCKEALEIGRLWRGTNPIAALYPLIFMSLGEEEARRLFKGLYRIPFRPGFAYPPPLPANVVSISIGACSLAQSFGKSDHPSTMNAYRTYWDQAVVAAVETVLSECLFFDVWKVDNLDAEAVDHLETFKADFLEIFRADVRKQNEHIRKERVLSFARELAQLRSKMKKMDETLRFLCQRDARKKPHDTEKSGANVPSKTAAEIQQTKKLMGSLVQEARSLEERLKEATVRINSADSLNGELLLDLSSTKRRGNGRPTLEAPIDPRLILGKRLHGPLEKRSIRAEQLKKNIRKCVDSRLDQKHILGTFFCEVRHASLLRKHVLRGSRHSRENRLSQEKYATAKLLYTLKKPPQFDIDDVPSRQIIVTVGRAKESLAGVEIIVAESRCVADTSSESKKFESKGVVRALTAFFEKTLVRILDEKNPEAFGCDSDYADVDDEDTEAENGREPAEEMA